MKQVTAAIIVRDDKVLLTRRTKGEDLSGFWEFPGGKVLDGESPQECLEREVLEELGFVARAGRVLATSEYQYEHGSFQIIALETKILSGDISLTVHDRAEWVPLAQLMTYRLAPADVPIAQKLVEVQHGV